MTDVLPSGLETSEFSSDIRPQDVLYRHVNGAWLARTEIPGDKARDFAKWEVDWDRKLMSSGGWEPQDLGLKRWEYNGKMGLFESTLLDLEIGGGVSFSFFGKYNEQWLTGTDPQPYPI